jgi:hypothetical protein
MQQTVTLSIPDSLAESAEAEAQRTSQTVEAVLLSWLNRAGNDDLNTLSDDDLLVVCASRLEAAQQGDLSDLLERNREGLLDASSRERLQGLMAEYQRGTLRKAQALKIAVGRGLKSGLN